VVNDMVLRSLARPSLEVLDVSSSNPFGGNRSLTNAAVDDFALHTSSLQELSLRGCANVEASGVERLGHFAVRLQHLDLTGCNLIGADVHALSKALRGYHALRWLSLRGLRAIDDTVLRGVADGCHDLEYLDLEGCTRITPRGLAAIFANCRRLKTLVLRGTSYGQVHVDELLAKQQDEAATLVDGVVVVV